MFLNKFKVMLSNDELWNIKSEHNRKKTHEVLEIEKYRLDNS